MRRICLLLALLLTLGLTGCLQQEQGTAYAVYYLNREEGTENALASEKHTLPQDTQPVEGLLQLLLTEPQSEVLEKAIPDGVRVRKWSIHNGLLTVDFFSAHASLSGIDRQFIFSMAAIVVQSLTNSFGTTIMAVSTAVMRVDGFAMMPNFTFSSKRQNSS